MKEPETAGTAADRTLTQEEQIAEFTPVLRDEEYKPKYWLHALLFLVTLGTTTLAGTEWMFPGAFVFSENSTLTWDLFWQGLWFSAPFLGILTAHEFGHYLMARHYRVLVTLPYYIPLWLGFMGGLSIGTLGAFIRIKEVVPSRAQLFDIGAAGPLAGYVAILIVLGYGYTHLPPPEHIFSIHPEYIPFGMDYANVVYKQAAGNLVGMGSTLTVKVMELLASDPAAIPNQFELMHYPLLFAGHVALFFTALNLFPIGQLDGGHILYGMVGPKWHRMLSPLFFIMLVFYSGLGSAQPISLQYDTFGWEKLEWNLFYLVFLMVTFSKTAEGFLNIAMLSLAVFAGQYLMAVAVPGIEGYNGWLAFCFVLGRFLGVYHPPALIEEPIGRTRMIVGVLSILVFMLSFSPKAFWFE